MKCDYPPLSGVEEGGNAYAVSIADIMIHSYVCSMKSKLLRRFHFAPNIVPIVLTILVEFSWQIQDL